MEKIVRLLRDFGQKKDLEKYGHLGADRESVLVERGDCQTPDTKGPLVLIFFEFKPSQTKKPLGCLFFLLFSVHPRENLPF